MKPDMTDKDLDQLLSELSAPDLPKGLVTGIMARLPERKAGWRSYIAELLGMDGVGLPAGGAFASLVFGVLAGYMFVPAATDAAVTTDEAEIAYAAAFGTESWLDLTEDAS